MLTSTNLNKVTEKAMARGLAQETRYPLKAGDILKAQRNPTGPFVFLETSKVVPGETRSYLFSSPCDSITAYSVHDSETVFKKIEDALVKGSWVAGWIGYEWGYCLEPRLKHLLESKAPKGPLLWLGIFKKPLIWKHSLNDTPQILDDVPDISSQISQMDLDVSKNQYIDAVKKIHEYIRSGDTYQVNYTIRGRFRFSGNPVDLYLALRANQAVSYGALIFDNTRWIVSLSPELFFKVNKTIIESRPMKGTLPRGRTLEEDLANAASLSNDIKNRAENVMIVDLIRNDIGRLSKTGTVHVPQLFTVERFETLLQMTSTVKGTLADPGNWADIFKALFPCGSITGAPKIRTMEIIAELESSPRSVYTGAVGFISPSGNACFNVAIRTVLLEGERAEIGIGSGVTIGSNPEAEYEETRLKAYFVKKPFEEFELIETLKWEKNIGYWLLDLHLKRLESSAQYFGFKFDLEAVSQALAEHVEKTNVNKALKVRLLLHRDSSFEIESEKLNKLATPLRVAIASRRIDQNDPFFFHKTTKTRPFFQKGLEEIRAKNCDEALFLNQEGVLTEGSFTNLFVEKDGRLLTPPVQEGLLNGVFRRYLLSTGRAAEKRIWPEDLQKADKIYVGNSVRGLMEAVFVPCLEVGKG